MFGVTPRGESARENWGLGKSSRPIAARTPHAGPAQAVFQRPLVDLGSEAVGMRPIAATALFDQSGHAANLKGTADFVEGVALVAHDVARKGEIAEFVGEL